MKIHKYVQKSDIAGVVSEIARGVDIDCIHEDKTPLMRAVASKNIGIEIIKILVENGADVNACLPDDDDGNPDPYLEQKTVLDYAVETGDLEKIKFLLDAGANTNCQRKGRPPILERTVFILSRRAKNRNLVPVLKLLIERGAKVSSDIDFNDEFRESPFFLSAAEMGKFDAVKLLLAAGEDPKYLRWTELMSAIVFGSLAEVKALLEGGADLLKRDCDQRTPWLLSLQVGQLEKARLLLSSGANRDDCGEHGKTPLMYPIDNDHVEVLEWLIEEGFDLEAANEQGYTSLIYAARLGATECVRILLEVGANIEATDKFGATPLIHAAGYGGRECVRLLLEAGANIEATNESGDTPLIYAAGSGATECVRILLEAGANPQSRSTINVPCEPIYYSRTAIASASNLEIVKMLANAQGGDISDLAYPDSDNEEMWELLRGVSCSDLKNIPISPEQYRAGKYPRFGTINPEVMEVEFWKAMVCSCSYASDAREHFLDRVKFSDRRVDKPVWCYHRWGRTSTLLPDGRVVEIGGYHEDYCDPDFCIYNDVVVYDGNGDFKILGYPEDVFPPTDQHSATLVGDYIYIIGNTNHNFKEVYDETPVYRLHCYTFKMEKIETTGDKLGWICNHLAYYQEPSLIHVTSGQIWVRKASQRKRPSRINIKNSPSKPKIQGKWVENSVDYILDLKTFNWSGI